MIYNSRCTTFENAEVGDKVWSIELGWGKVITRHRDAITVEFDNGTVGGFLATYKNSGVYNFSGWGKDIAKRTLFWDEIKPLEAPYKPVRKPKRPKLKQDDVVLLHDGIRYHVDGADQDVLYIFPSGMSSKTTNRCSVVVSWDSVKEVL